jgi:PAS domain S-box-containing protein
MNMLDSIDDPIFAKDQEHKWVFLNEAACNFWGKKREALLGKSDYDLFPREQADVYWEKDNIVFVTEKPDLNEEAQTINTKEHTISTKKSFYRDPQSGEKYVVGTIRDITASKMAQDALKESEQNYRAIFDSANEVIFIQDIETGDIVDANKALYDLYGYKVEEVKNKKTKRAGILNAGFEPYTEKEALVLIKKAAKGKPQLFEWLARKKDGSLFWVEVSLKKVLIKGKNHVLAMVRDITERKKAEEELRKSEEKYRRLIENANEAIIIVQDDRLKFVNPKTVEITGLSEQELINRSFLELVHWDDRTLVFENYAKKLNGEPFPDRYSFRLIDSKGNIKWLQISDVLIYWENNPATLSFMIDITEQKRTELELKLKDEQLIQSQKIEAVGRLAGGIAHDFNNILTAIIGYSEVLLMDSNIDKKYRGFAKQIKSSADRASSLTQQLLAFSRSQILKPRLVNLNILVKGIHKMLQSLIGEDVDLVIRNSSNLGMIRVDTGQIEQVIMNLAINARDAMPVGGKLIIETQNAYLNEDYCKTHYCDSPGHYVVLVVSDTGHGMDEDIREHIFEPFFTTKEVGKGTGLGLATVYGIVKQSGGHIGVFSELNEGTTFKLYFPRVDEREGQKKNAGQAETRPVRGRETILLVEDEEVVRTMIVTGLKAFGYKVLEASSGVKALRICKQCRKKQVDMLITDVVMPEMSGRNLADRLLNAYPEMKILYISGYTDDFIVHHGVLDEGIPFLQKPFTPNVLAMKVREIFDS